MVTSWYCILFFTVLFLTQRAGCQKLSSGETVFIGRGTAASVENCWESSLSIINAMLIMKSKQTLKLQGEPSRSTFDDLLFPWHCRSDLNYFLHIVLISRENSGCGAEFHWPWMEAGRKAAFALDFETRRSWLQTLTWSLVALWPSANLSLFGGPAN